MQTLQTILVPLDGSEPSIAALEHAVALASDYRARLEVLHVLPTSDPMSTSARRQVERDMNDALHNADRLLGYRIPRRMVSGDPVEEIVEAARSGVDLIVMGTHGRVGRLHAMLGSVTEGVVRNAPCPVLTVRDQSAGYQSFTERRHGRLSVGERARDEEHHR